jgi:dTDP-4-amino-4,6-dideoxygalactose transaminase
MIKEKFVHQFETSFAAYLGIKNVIGTSMGRTALYAVLKAIEVKEHDEVIIPAYICEVVPNAIIKAGGTPVLVDINENNFHISLSHLTSLINEKTRAIIINHPFGVPEKIDEILEIINKQPGKIFLIEDAAQALGAEYKGKKIGSFGDAAIFSLAKNMINIGGGAVVTNNQVIEESVRKYIHESRELSIVNKVFFGFFSFFDTYSVNSKICYFMNNLLKKIPNKVMFARNNYDSSLKIPDNLSMSILQAYLAMVQIKTLDKFNIQRTLNEQFLIDELKTCESIGLFESDTSESRHICTWFAIRIKDKKLRESMLKNCAKENIFLHQFWDPIVIPGMSYGTFEQKTLNNSNERSEQTIVFKMNDRISRNKLREIVIFLKKIVSLNSQNILE